MCDISARMRIAGITKGWIPDLGKLNCWIYIDMKRIPFSALLHLTPPPPPPPGITGMKWYVTCPPLV